MQPLLRFLHVCKCPGVGQRVCHPTVAVGTYIDAVTQRAAAVGAVGSHFAAAGNQICIVQFITLLQFLTALASPTVMLRICLQEEIWGYHRVLIVSFTVLKD